MVYYLHLKEATVVTQIIQVPAAHGFNSGTIIDLLFRNVGIPGYFTLPTEIPVSLFEQLGPNQDYKLVVVPDVPRVELRQHKLRPPTIRETLWAIGYMNLE